ncbi:HVA22-like protein j [Hibiscus syriacus]|nr:HVA22-like protein j [Hibiscus syriacus]
MLGDFINRILVLVLGYAYPAFECFKTVEKNKVGIGELRFWCQYWILMAFLIVFEWTGEVFISWLPMYGEMKVGMLVYLWYPKTKGTGYVYDTLLRPFMARHETEVDRKIQEIKARIWDFIFKYCQHFAVMGQGKFFEMLQYMANQSLKFKQANQKSDDPSTPNGHRDSPRMRSRPVQT